MKKAFPLLYAVLLSFGVSGSVGAADAPPGASGPPPLPPGHETEDVENAIMPDLSKPQHPGLDLNGPGDLWRYTFFLDKKHLNDDWELTQAVVALHIIDPDYDKEAKKDGAPEWARITVNGKPVKTWAPPVLTATGYRKGQEPFSTELVELDDEAEVHPSGRMPAYIFNPLELEEAFKKTGKVIIEVTNVRQDGTIEGSAPFGNFIVLRSGLHFVWKKK
jgi:hypothetical protein